MRILLSFKNGKLLHNLDVGGRQPTETSGVKCVLMGLRETHGDDGQVLQAATQVFNSLLVTYGNEQ